MNRASGRDASPAVSERVVDAVAAETGKLPTELEPLYHSIASECLDELFPATDEPTRQFTFTYEAHVVTVAHDGSVEVAPTDDGASDGPRTDPANASAQGAPRTPD